MYRSGATIVLTTLYRVASVCCGRYTGWLLCVAAAVAFITHTVATQCQTMYTRDVHGNGIPNGTGNSMGMGIKHRIGNGNGRQWETTSVGMGITCTPMGIYSQRFYAAMSLLSY